MREKNALVDLDAVSLAHSKRGAGKIAEAINRDAGGLFETRNQIGRREMREVVLDVVGLRLNLDPVKLLERFLDRCGAPDVLDFLPHQLRMWPTRENESEAPQIVYARLAIDRDVIDLLHPHFPFLQTIIDRLGRKSGPMLDPAKPFFLRRGD